jgi:hypothetical protein
MILFFSRVVSQSLFSLSPSSQLLLRLSHAISKSNTPPHKNITSSAQCERPCTEKLDEENSKHAGLAQENGFLSLAHLHSLLRLVKGRAKAMHLRVKSVMNMI